MTKPKSAAAAADAQLPAPPPLDAGAGDTPPTPPKSEPKKKTGTGRPPGRPRNTPKLADRIEGMIGGIGVGVMAFDPYDGRVILQGAPELASALDQWAAENPAVRKTLERMLDASAAGAVLIAVARMALPIAAHHNILPGDYAALGFGPVAGGAADPVPTPPAPAPNNGVTG